MLQREPGIRIRQAVYLAEVEMKRSLRLSETLQYSNYGTSRLFSTASILLEILQILSEASNLDRKLSDVSCIAGGVCRKISNWCPRRLS